MKKELLGILWGIVFGFIAFGIGTFIGFSLFGLLFFANTKLATIIIGSLGFISFFISIIFSLIYWKKRELVIDSKKMITPIIILFIEIIIVIGLIYLLNANVSKMYDDKPVVISTDIIGILEKEEGNYSLVAKVKENSYCFCPEGIICESCLNIDSSYLIFTDDFGNNLEVSISLSDESVRNLSIGKYYYIIVENTKRDGETHRILRNITRYGPD